MSRCLKFVAYKDKSAYVYFLKTVTIRDASKSPTTVPLTTHSNGLESTFPWLQGSCTGQLQIPCHVLKHCGLTTNHTSQYVLFNVHHGTLLANASQSHPFEQVCLFVCVLSESVCTDNTYFSVISISGSKSHARSPAHPPTHISSQTEQEMSKLKINPIKNNYFQPFWICTGCSQPERSLITC